MSLLAAAKTDENIQNETDTVGGGGVWESGLYPAEVSMAYLEKKPSGAVFLNVTLKNDQGQETKEGLCILSGDAKGNKNYYETQNGDRKYLPGFNTANSIALLACKKELADLDTEMKVIPVYNPESQREEPTKVEVVVEMLGARAIFGIQKQIVEKRQKNPQTGQYEGTGETREVNEIDKVFREADKLTTAEIRAGAEEPAFYNTWDEKWTGKTRNRVPAANDANGGMASAGGTAGAPNAGGNGGKTSKPAGSLFG